MRGLIVSDPEIGKSAYGLTDNGRQQVIQVRRTWGGGS